MLPTDDNDWLEDLRVELSERDVAQLSNVVGETLVFTGSKTAAALWLVVPGTLAFVLGALLAGPIWTSSLLVLSYFIALPLLWWALRWLTGRWFGPAIRWQALTLFFFTYFLGAGAALASSFEWRWWAYGISSASGFLFGMVYGSLDPPAIRNKEAWMAGLPLGVFSSLVATYLLRHPGSLTSFQITVAAAAIAGILFTAPMMVLLMRLWDNALGLRHLGLMYLHHPAFLKRSNGCFAKALEIAPDNVDLHNLGGVVWSRLGDSARAEANWTRALELDPNNAETVRHRTDALIREEAFDDALLLLKSAVQTHPKHAPLYANLAIAYSNRGDKTRALEHFDRAIELESRRPSNYAWRAKVHFARGDFDKVIADCSNAIDINREFAMPLMLRGEAYASTGEFEKACEDFRDAIDAAPNENVANEARERLRDVQREAQNRGANFDL